MTLRLVHELSETQVKALWRLFHDEWWTAGRTPEGVRAMLDGSHLAFALVGDGGELAAFARVLTDGVYKALVLDVIVAPSWRGEGLGRRLMGAILGHPDLAGVQHFELYCLPEMIPFYEQWGFTADLGDLRFLRRS